MQTYDHCIDDLTFAVGLDDGFLEGCLVGCSLTLTGQFLETVCDPEEDILSIPEVLARSSKSTSTGNVLDPISPIPN